MLDATDDLRRGVDGCLGVEQIHLQREAQMTALAADEVVLIARSQKNRIDCAICGQSGSKGLALKGEGSVRTV